MVRRIERERRANERDQNPTGLVSLSELKVMRAAIMQLTADAGGKGVPAWVQDFARVVHTMAVTYERANELRRATIEQAAAIAEECGSGEAAERIRGIA